MHGLFYTSPPFADAVAAFWNKTLSPAQRDAWRAFLDGLGYDSANEELVLNEFQAYMATESELFGGGGMSGVPARKPRGAGGAGGELVATLTAMQAQFATALGGAVPQPAPRVGGCACVFSDGCAPAPFRLKQKP